MLSLVDADRDTRQTALHLYQALGDGRSVAVTGRGSVDWWCVPDLGSPPLFDRILDPDEGGFFALAPVEPFEVDQHYRPGSNVLVSEFRTATGRARLTESLNSGLAGRLPWNELGRRLEGLEGEVAFRLALRIGTHHGTAEPRLESRRQGWLFTVAGLMGLLVTPPTLTLHQTDERTVTGEFVLPAGQRAMVGLVTGENEPLVVPDLAEIDERIDISDKAWRDWSDTLRCDGPYADAMRRSALALKLLLFSPSGAIAAAATNSLPERIGGNKNWDYRYAWVRDAAFTIDAFLKLGLTQECKAGFTWLAHQAADGLKVCYTLWGEPVPLPEDLPLPGYRGSRPVVAGNAAAAQHQHGIFADLLEVTARFTGEGHLLDPSTARTLAAVADQCADRWREKDSGIWELQDLQHYTLSKISAWQALDRAVRLAGQGHLDDRHAARWAAERDAAATWVGEHCWSEAMGAYTFYPGTDKLDASLARAALVEFGPPERLHATCDAIRRELARGPLLYRYTGMETQEGAFLACSFWLVQAYAHLGRIEEAEALMAPLMATLDGAPGVLSEMIDPRNGDWLGNLPQGLSHLALIDAACAILSHGGGNTGR